MPTSSAAKNGPDTGAGAKAPTNPARSPVERDGSLDTLVGTGSPKAKARPGSHPGRASRDPDVWCGDASNVPTPEPQAHCGGPESVSDNLASPPRAVEGVAGSGARAKRILDHRAEAPARADDGPPPHVLGTALWFLESGHWPVLISPVDSKDTTSPGKAPIGRAWGAERHDERWWRSSLKRTPKAGVGLKLGAEGGVIDIDVDDPEAAAPVLARIFPDGIPETMGWSNAGGRRHLLFRWDDRLARYGKAIIKGQRRADGKIIGNPKYLGLEIRIGAAEAGGKQYQSVIPPSLLKDAEARRWNEHAEILPAPPCLFADLDAHHAATVEPPSPAAIPVAPKAPRGASSRPNATDRARAFLTTCEPAVSGQGGHAKAFKVVCHLARHDLPAEVALSLLLAEWNPRCEPPWSEAELRHKVDEAYRKETRRDRKDEAAPSNGRTNGHVGGGRADGRPERNGGSGKPPADRRDGGDRPPPRPKIEITTEEHEVADLAISAVARDPDVFQRANLLMTILRDVPRGDRSILRPPGSPRITLLREPRLRELMSKSAIWLKREKDKDQLTPAHVPKWAVQALAGRGTWPDIRPIEGVTETPMLRPDGTVLDQPGYDNMMGLLYEPNAEFPTIPVNPNRDDAKNAAVALLNLVQDFPFADFTDQVAWLAGC